MRMLPWLCLHAAFIKKHLYKISSCKFLSMIFEEKEQCNFIACQER
jgi:hypothetical protein